MNENHATSMNGPVAVTGVTGFIAAFVVEELLNRGHTVHGTVRSLEDQSKYAHLLAFEGSQCI